MSTSIATPISDLDLQPTASQVAAFAAQGAGLVRAMLSPEEIAEIRDTFTSAAQDGPVEAVSEKRTVDLPDGGPDPLKKWPRMLHPHRRPDTDFGSLALRWMLSERFEPILRGVMGETPLAAQSMFYFKPPGARGQALHQDNLSLRVSRGRDHGYATCVAAWIAVDRADAENGALAVVPGTGHMELLCPDDDDPEAAKKSFIGGGLRVPAGYEETIAEMEAGDVLFFNGSLVHGSHANRSGSRFRRSLIFHYVPESCAEVAEFYHPLLDFSGNVIDKERSAYLNPCGGPEGNAD